MAEEGVKREREKKEKKEKTKRKEKIGETSSESMRHEISREKERKRPPHPYVLHVGIRFRTGRQTSVLT